MAWMMPAAAHPQHVQQEYKSKDQMRKLYESHGPCQAAEPGQDVMQTLHDMLSVH
jgi:hypothetical protein